MTESVYDPEGATGYRMEQLAAAFDRVRNPRDWKAPIQAVIPATDRPVVEKAVLWFTNTVPVFVASPGESDRMVVMAPGYRLGPAGGLCGKRHVNAEHGHRCYLQRGHEGAHRCACEYEWPEPFGAGQADLARSER